ncbi:putative multiheme cytochrome c [Thermincola ferriacetica]|uniref:Putative multiheme cytochrome c n=1 Tax=Thermincola ferriacetica TaxID=281456 RepID=A0A0L6W4T5_9FIRM|nr:cytochrome c3 family protein [Thermincola ferriacetica]KNZ70540.1 putative multiheme cytochrome c [Thermincola ferriacetica]
MKKKLFTVLLTGMFVFGAATSAFAAYSGLNGTPDTMGAPSYTAPLTDGDEIDLGPGNANATGNGVELENPTNAQDPYNVIKSKNMLMNDFTGPRTQRTHGEYQNNTNSCASCHQTHTGASKDLLFKMGVYNTCTACHDGTLGFYNVFATKNIDGSLPTAGTFGGTMDGNASVHLAEGYIEHALAPGGNLMKTGTNNGAWGDKFDCASCHSPHGSYSDRLLHYNPNGMATVSIANGGQKVSDSVYDALPQASATSPDFVVYRTTADAVGVTQETTGTPIIVLMKKVQNADKTYSYVMDKTPWLYGYPYYSAPHYTAFWDANNKELNEKGIEVEYGLSYAKGDVNLAVRADISRVYVVKLGGPAKQKDGTIIDMPMQKIADFGGVAITKVNPDIYDEAGYGVAIGKYCGACHVDYLAASAGNRKDYVNGTGMYTTAFRHTTNNDRYTCLKCHFAHGTDVTVMKDANDWTVDRLVAAGKTDQATAKAYLLDKNPSSALKRYTNMAVCWKCHTDSKAEQLKNNDFFWNTAGVPHGGSTGIDTSLEHNW